MSFFDYFRFTSRKPVEIVVPPQPEHLKQPKTYAFVYRFFVNYTNNENKQGTYNWTSELYLDHNKALEASRKIVKDIGDAFKNATADDEPVFIIDIAIKKKAFISATASDPTLLEFTNGVLSRAINIQVYEGENIVIVPGPDGDKISGKYRTMKDSVSF